MACSVPESVRSGPEVSGAEVSGVCRAGTSKVRTVVPHPPGLMPITSPAEASGVHLRLRLVFPSGQEASPCQGAIRKSLERALSPRSRRQWLRAGPRSSRCC